MQCGADFKRASGLTLHERLGTCTPDTRTIVWRYQPVLLEECWVIDRRRVDVLHQIALYEFGQCPPGKGFVLHSCDRPECINPEHLRWGSQAENMRDKQERGRAGHTEVARRKIAAARTGMTFSESHRENIRKSIVYGVCEDCGKQAPWASLVRHGRKTGHTVVRSEANVDRPVTPRTEERR